MQFTIETDLNTLKAVCLFKSAKDKRYYLQGVHLETGPEGARLTATNGHYLAAVFIPGAYPVTEGIISGGMLDALLKIIGKVPAVEILVDHTGAIPVYSIGGLTKPGIDGRFPDVRRVIDVAPSDGIGAQFNPEYVALFGKAAKLLGRSPGDVCIVHNGRGMAARVHVLGREDFLGVLMPMRTASEDEPECPPWFHMKLNPPADSVAA
ncbi:MAG TPA: hypothetical protein VJ396_09425 [Acidiferrobacterales bacterium]|nr:hypothetical protein [Acidiferrobacterales bacterium]